MVYLTVASEFKSAHMLRNPLFTREKNARVFGECANPAGHGHLFRVEITLVAPVSPERPYVAKRGSMRRIIDDVLGPRFNSGFLNSGFWLLCFFCCLFIRIGFFLFFFLST